MIKLLTSGLLGSMIFFISVITPTVFNSLNEENRSLFLRKVFPRVFLFSFIILIFCSLLAYLENLFIISIILFINSLIFIINRNIITPKINQFRDKSLKGDKKSEYFFKSLHKLSVILFLIPMLSLMMIIMYLSF